MPSGKPRDFEDTWKPEELHKSIKGTSSRKDKDRKEKDKDRDKDKERRKDRDKDKDRDKEKRPKDDDSKRRERRHRDKENGELEKPKDKNKEKEKSHRSKDEDGSRERRHRRHRDYDDNEDDVDGGKSHGRHRESSREKSKDKDRKDRKHRDEDKEKRRKDDDGKERRHRDKDGDRHKDRDDDKKRRHRDEGADDDRRRRHRDKDEEDPEKERRRHRDERDKSHSKKKHQDEEVTPERSDRNKDGEKKERKKRSEENGDEGERERDRRRRHRDRETSEERRERKKREKEEEKRRKEKEEEEKRKQEIIPKSSDEDSGKQYYRELTQTMPWLFKSSYDSVLDADSIIHDSDIVSPIGKVASVNCPLSFESIEDKCIDGVQTGKPVIPFSTEDSGIIINTSTSDVKKNHSKDKRPSKVSASADKQERKQSNNERSSVKRITPRKPSIPSPPTTRRSSSGERDKQATASSYSAPRRKSVNQVEAPMTNRRKTVNQGTAQTGSSYGSPRRKSVDRSEAQKNGQWANKASTNGAPRRRSLDQREVHRSMADKSRRKQDSLGRARGKTEERTANSDNSSTNKQLGSQKRGPRFNNSFRDRNPSVSNTSSRTRRKSSLDGGSGKSSTGSKGKQVIDKNSNNEAQLDRTDKNSQKKTVTEMAQISQVNENVHEINKRSMAHIEFLPTDKSQSWTGLREFSLSPVSGQSLLSRSSSNTSAKESSIESIRVAVSKCSLQGETLIFGEENGEDDYDYEDDFEDYDDDFEDDDGQDEDEDEEDEADKPSRGEMDEVLRAMNEENERLMQQAKDGWSESEESEAPKSNSKRPKTAGRSFINFVSAKQRAISSKAANKAKERGSKLLEIIDMDQTSFDMFDMPPVNEYEMYMRSFGQSNTKQAYIQTNDDNIDRDVQTEEIETSEKWSQHPPEEIRASGGGDNEEDDLEKQMKPTDTVQLSKFLTKAGQVIAILLEESLAESSRNEEGSKKSSIYISEAFSELGQVPFLKGRRIICSQFATSQTHLLLTVHGLPKQTSEDDPLASKGFLCVWNVNEPSAPQKVLVCESEPSCCCFSPTKATLAFAGMNEGSLAVWDLRESTSLHRKHSQSNREWSLRYPTYNTAGVLHYDNHQSGLRTVAPIAGPATNEVSAGSEEAGLSFQLATLEENSTLHLWVVAEITHPDVAGSESDLGLSPGGKIKLIKSSTIPLENPLRDTRLRTTMKSYELQLLPSDPSNYYVSTNTGCILHGVRYGGKAPPRAYRTEDDSQLNITCIDFSPFPNGAFLAGCSDGSLRLYATRNEFPLLVWPRATEGRPVTAVRWCRSRPSVFFVMDDKSHMYIWDLLMNETESLKKERISDHRVTSFALSNDHSATGIGTPERTPQMAIGLSTGDIEVHTISQKFSALMPEEVDQFSQLLNNSM